MKKRSWILIFGLAVLVTACLIFLFSAQDGTSSSDTSAGVTEWLLRVFRPDYPSLSAGRQAALFNAWHSGVRKAAHFTEFTALGLFLRLLLFRALKSRLKTPLAWLAGTLYACTDELHQLYVGQRSASWGDVAIDSAGVLFGVLLALLILRLWKKKPPDGADDSPEGRAV